MARTDEPGHRGSQGGKYPLYKQFVTDGDEMPLFNKNRIEIHFTALFWRKTPQDKALFDH